MPTPQAHASSAAQALDDADGVRDGKFYGRQIVETVNPLFEDNITPQGQAEWGSSEGPCHAWWGGVGSDREMLVVLEQVGGFSVSVGGEHVQSTRPLRAQLSHLCFS